MRDRMPNPSRRPTHCRQRHTFRRRTHMEEVLKEVLRFYRIAVPEQDGPLTYQQVEELVRERRAVELSQYQQLFDLGVHSLKSSLALHRAHEPEIFDGDTTIFSALPDEMDSSSSPSGRLAALCYGPHH